ncbi:MAG: hypothetical protein H6R07_999 [Proteobacteria bacterium]|nr:hypothetical protein [Pseudomonadota bacterium]
MAVKLGVIADDFTGATDIAGFMVEQGWHVVQLIGVPTADTLPGEVDAVVISLKSRSCAVEEATAQSVAACRWLKTRAGAEQIFFKYCSTFDSTPSGNIGPVIDALLAELDTNFTVVCPALPPNGRTVVHGHLFVNGKLLNRCGMENHPVTPMWDADIQQLLAPQSRARSGLVALDVIQQGPEAIALRLQQLRRDGVRYAVLDALTMPDLQQIAAAVGDLPLLTGGSGLGATLAARVGVSRQQSQAAILPAADSRAVVLAGSCSVMTNRQVAAYRARAASFELDVARCLDDAAYVKQLVQWVLNQPQTGWAPMLYATQPPEKLQQIQQQHGAAKTAQAIEQVFSAVAAQLYQAGFSTFIVAGGETSGSVVQGLGVTGFHIGLPIVPGVPWVRDLQRPIHMALKSGNFGDEHFFERAQEIYRD